MFGLFYKALKIDLSATHLSTQMEPPLQLILPFNLSKGPIGNLLVDEALTMAMPITHKAIEVVEVVGVVEAEVGTITHTCSANFVENLVILSKNATFVLMQTFKALAILHPQTRTTTIIKWQPC
ncbi:hypothetical protein PanWU01x14_247700 [Parasponia andersonii]|uniref:Uncharacterized protein n=1 Tax=Parasponia andersonii TaxID=3476 RepID=A0A2P5BE14_PARAD|nr:hypothetical protein PanWU01x14_247700 [Parasponia andersonii]